MTSTPYVQSYITKHKALAALYLIWAGLVIGVSFISAPLKFQADHLTPAVALEIGKITFHFLSNLELILLIITGGLAVTCSTKWRFWSVFALLGLVILSQKFGLLPVLDVRADLVIAGGNPTPGHHLHWLYIILECIKLILLIIGATIVGTSAFMKNKQQSHKQDLGIVNKLKIR